MYVVLWYMISIMVYNPPGAARVPETIKAIKQ